MNTIFLSTSYLFNALIRAEFVDGQWQVSRPLSELIINCLVSDPHYPGRVYAGTKSKGLLRSDDNGRTWTEAGLKEAIVKAVAIHPTRPGKLFAACKPISLYVSSDSGANWEELPNLRSHKKWWWFSPAEPPDWRPYVQALTISPTEPDVMLAGMEIGGVLRSTDGGLTWSKSRPGALLDCHSLSFHPTNGDWAYEGGGSGIGAAISRDGGLTWKQTKAGLGRKYGWMTAADYHRPEVCYLSASPHGSLLRGQFVPIAHSDGAAQANIYRSIDGGAWEKLSGGLPDPLPFMAYALITDPATAGGLYAGLANGDVWHTTNYGDNWVKLPFTLGSIHRTMIIC